jgi:hypothetical protein
MVKTRRDKVDINKKTNKNGGLNILNQNIIYLQNSLASKIFEVEHLLNFTCKEIETDYSCQVQRRTGRTLCCRAVPGQVPHHKHSCGVGEISGRAESSA